MERLIAGKRRVTALALALALGMLSLAAAALADENVADGDGLTPVTNQNMSFGNVSCGVATNKTALLAIQRTSSGANVFKNSSMVNVSVDSVTGTGLGATMTDSTIDLPATWSTAAANSMSTDTASSTVTINSTTPGAGAGSVVYKATGQNNVNGNTLTRSDTMNVTWNTVGCDATPPSISYVLNPATADGANGWYTSNVTLTWTVTENESPSSLVKTGCVDQNITADQQETTYSCSATSDGGSAAPVNVKIKRDATPPNVSVTGFTDGQVFVKGDTLPTAGCSRSDLTSGIDATGSTGPTASGGLNANGVGTVTYTCGARDNAGNTNSDSKSYSVIYDYSGFFRPVDNPDVFNKAKAGSAIPVKFSLDGDQGLDILATDFPKSKEIDCITSADKDPIEQTVTAGKSGLKYDPTTDTYSYVWKTDKSWAGTCRKLKVKLDDGTTHKAKFKFKN